VNSLRLYQKILLAWLALLLFGAATLLGLPHRETTAISLVVIAVMTLLGLICLAVFLREPNPKNKPVFLNFAIFFILSSIASFLPAFIGKAFWVEERFAGLFAYQYSTTTPYFFLPFALIYLVFDSLFNGSSIAKKYLMTFLLVGGVFAYYNHPIYQEPKYLYSTQDIVDFKLVATSVDELKKKSGSEPTPKEIAATIELNAWESGRQVGTLFEDEELRRVEEILPYLAGSNFIPLLFRPLYFSNIYMNVLCVVFVFLFFGYQYKNDPPQGAYIEKILFLFLPYCSLEILHHYGYIKSVEFSTFLDFMSIGGLLSLLNLFMLVVFFSLRLRFITSVKGEFYERELVSDSEHISRWRDGFDDLIVHHFLNPKTFHGRFLAPRPPRNES